MWILLAVALPNLVSPAAGTAELEEVHHVAVRMPSLRGASVTRGDALLQQRQAVAAENEDSRGNRSDVSKSSKVYQFIETLDRLRITTDEEYHAAVALRNNERLRLSGALAGATVDADRAAIQTTVEQSELNEKEAQYAYMEMLKFYYTTKAVMGAEALAPSCALLNCGEQARCVGHSSGKGFTCACKPCYEGNGFICRPTTCKAIPSHTALPLFPNTKRPVHMKEVHLTVFSQDQVAVVYRDASQGDRGFFMLGDAGEAEIKWGKSQSFSGKSPAFGPVALVLPTKRLVIGFRDANRDGMGNLVGGHLRRTTDSKKHVKAVFKKPFKFARNQAQHMVLVPLMNSRVVCLFSHRSLDAKGHVKEAQGRALLVQMLAGGSIGLLGKYVFSHFPVTQISAVSIRPNSFVVAFRARPIGEPAGSPSKELSALYVEMQNNLLITDTNPLVLEPGRKDMYQRDVSLVSENLIAYSYQSGSEQKTKMQIIRVDPRTHGMQVMDGPKELGHGPSAFVRSVSQPFLAMAPHTLTCIQHQKSPSLAKMCRISPQGGIADCQEMSWTDTEVTAMSAARISDGRLLFVFADTAGRPFYQLLGAPQ